MHRGGRITQPEGQGLRPCDGEADGGDNRRPDKNAGQGTQHPFIQDRCPDCHRGDHRSRSESCLQVFMGRSDRQLGILHILE